ncbi:epidermal growth factor receptor substrate 15-like 1 isoform X2 [Phlebotomus papatasi]|uniref:epidermal growth factor receptor substrate 15-like 1 isoform X2 n=1 Tax=Phlebotomus papatasi TaxID=29031 RepID=UPI00248424E5|nr:epidermal growth factor receptor substrate 15-like 1 isoform X2 [Phlebotomus papatasi]
MSGPSNLAQVAGKHVAIYEAYYKLANPKGNPSIGAMDAARFLKKSTLSDVVLSRIWDLSDPQGRGYLDKAGFYTALKFVALAQAGEDINIENIYTDTQNPPKVGAIPKIPPQVPPPAASMLHDESAEWAMTPADEAKYQEKFNSLNPVGGLLPGNQVKGVLMNSKLPVDTLGKIWDLADQDRDGSLDIYEFSVAMHLVYHALQKRHIPARLPTALKKSMMKSSVAAPAPVAEEPELFAQFPTDLAPPPAPPVVPPLPAAALLADVARTSPALSNLNLLSDGPVVKPAEPDWVVSAEEKRNFDQIFKRSDLDNDGLVSGSEIKDIFLQSGVSQICLAHIWALCDTNQTGKLTSEQFALALWLVDRKKRGIDPPNVLAPNMVPPSLRAKPTQVAEAPALMPSKTPEPAYSNPELKMMAEEIEKIVTERRALEREMSQRAADIVIKTGEIRSLQKEMDTLTATLKQLEHQKVEAQKRLNDLQEQVKKINEQCVKQEETIREQEAEVDARRSQLQSLKDEEMNLSKEYDKNTKELDDLTVQLQDTQLQISQMKAMITQLQESQRQMRDALDSCKTAIETGDPDVVTDYYLKLNPDFREVRESMNTESKPKESPPVSTTTYSFDNKFEDDPFKPKTTDTWADTSGFDDSFDTPFNGQSKTHSDAFGDAFGGSGSADTNVTSSDTKDKFDEDPFAILHAPTTGGGNVHTNIAPSSQLAYRSTSPIPALPPKKSKQPPPRPAPPKSIQSKVKTFESESNDFANFADFNKFF